MSIETAARPQVATEQCPWCGSAISRSRFDAIEAKIAEKEKKKLAEERARMQQELRAEMQERLARAKEDNDKKVASVVEERDAKIREFESQKVAIRKEVTSQAEIRIKTAVEQKLAPVIKERDQASTKLKQLEAANKKELDHQRNVLEKDRDAQLLKKDVQHNRDREQLQEKIAALTRQLNRKTADELGEGAEIDVYEALRDAFSRDEIQRIKKGQPGADIRHQVLYKGMPCGAILIDSKNRQGWQNTYVTKLREDQMAAKADYAVLATTVFPSGKKELYVDDETRVIVVNRARAVEVVGMLRRAMVRMHLLQLSQSERAEKRELLYRYIESENFRQHVVEAKRLAGEMLDIDTEEKRSHDKVWEKRGRMATRLRNVVSEIDTEVSAILEGRTSPKIIQK